MRRFSFILLIILLFFMSVAFGEETAAPTEATTTPPHEAPRIATVAGPQVLIIGLGESVRVDLPSGAKVHISDGGVVRSRVIGRAILMTGQRTGKTSLRIVGSVKTAGVGDKTIVVTERKVATTARLFQEKIDAGRGLQFSTSALPNLIVTGELLRIEDWDTLVAIARESKVSWRLEARIFSGIQKSFREKIEAELTRLAWPGQKLSIDRNGPTLTGGSESATLSAEQKLGVTTLGIQLETSMGLTELEPMIRTQIVIAEVRRTHTRTLGVGWPDKGTQVETVPTLQIPTGQLVLNLQAMEQQGEGRILAMPALLCRSGGEAKFLAGGEIPIKMTTHRTAQVDWKKYGISLHVQPKADRMKRMKFQLSTEISTLDASTAIEGVPGLMTNKIETQFNLDGPQTIVLSGLLKREEGSSNNGLPLLQSIPILGKLFGSEDYRKHLTELIIFVSPEVVVPGEGASRD